MTGMRRDKLHFRESRRREGGTRVAPERGARTLARDGREDGARLAVQGSLEAERESH